MGGHSHNRRLKAEVLGSTLIVQAGTHGSDLDRLELTVERGNVTANVCILTLLDHNKVEADDAAERFLKRPPKPHRKAMDEVVGRRRIGWCGHRPWQARNTSARRAVAIDSLFAEILCERTGAGVAVLPGVGYGVAIPPGAITAAQLRQMVPHEGKVVTIRLSGTQIIEALEQTVESVFADDPAVKVGGMIQRSRRSRSSASSRKDLAIQAVS